jgi:Bacterial TniB protein
VTAEHQDRNNLFANLSVGERQMLMKVIFIEHDRFRDAWQAIRRSHYPVDGGQPDYGSISVIAGESRAGKTSVALRYMKDHPPTITNDGMIYPVLYVNIPIDGQRALLGFIADALGIKYSLRINNPTLQMMILKGLRDQKVEMLIFDEVNTIYATENRRTVVYTLNLFRKIVDHCKLNIVCIGLEETYELLAADPQLTGRGGLPYQIVRPYSWDCEDERKLFRLLCDEFDRKLPFNQRSNLQSSWFAQRLFYSSKGGIIGRLSDFLYRAGCLAINDGSDAIEVRHFAEAYERIKERGTEYNPWIHDPSLAPKEVSASVTRSGRSPRELFSKKPGPHAAN